MNLLPYCCARLRTTGKLCDNRAPIRLQDASGRWVYFCENHRRESERVAEAARGEQHPQLVERRDTISGPAMFD